MLETHPLLQVNTVSVLDLAEAGDLPLFFNPAIDRRLGQDEIRKGTILLVLSGGLRTSSAFGLGIFACRPSEGPL